MFGKRLNGESLLLLRVPREDVLCLLLPRHVPVALDLFHRVAGDGADVRIWVAPLLSFAGVRLPRQPDGFGDRVVFGFGGQVTELQLGVQPDARQGLQEVDLNRFWIW